MEMNTIALRGRVGSDPVIHTDENNTQPFTRFRMVVPRSRRRDDGTWEDLEGKWYTVKAWGHLAHNLNLALRKGHPVVVIGRPAAQGWLDKGGEMVTELAINAVSVGHDLNWGISTFSKIVRKDGETTNQAEPARIESDEGTQADDVTAAEVTGDVEETTIPF